MLDEKNKLSGQEAEKEVSNQDEKTSEQNSKLQEETLPAEEKTTETSSEVESVKETVEEKSVEKETTSAEKVEKEEASEAVDEIENEIAESSEKDTKERKEEPLPNYAEMTLEKLVEELGILIKDKPVQEISNHVNAIKSAFNLKYGKLLKSEKEKFLEEGGNIIDFRYENAVKPKYNSLLYDYKQQRNKYHREQEALLQQNLDKKLQLIDELKNLIDNANSDTMYREFQSIQTRWKEIGAIPRAKYSDTWRTYHHHVERFYDLLHLNKDLRDLDFKHNLEKKLKLVEKAEELAELDDVNEAFRELQILHKVWKEEIGPVGREHREEVWGRFSEATKKIHDKRHLFFKGLKSQYKKNIEAKLKVVEEIEAYDTSNNKNRNDWQKSINDIEKLRKAFFDAGYVPRGKGDEVWSRFREVTRKFNRKKNEFFRDSKKEQNENLTKKRQLVEQAVSLKDSEDWDTTLEIYKKIQADWKKIGHVPRKYSDKLWKEFKAACNYYFERYYASKEEANEELMKVFHQKKEYLEEIKKEVSDNTKITAENIKEYINNWRKMGRVPFEVRHIEGKFNKFLDKAFNQLSITKKESELIKFENIMQGYLQQEDFRKLDSEQLFLRKKIDETTREIQQLENNKSFISNVTDDNPLVKNVNKNIKKYKQQLEEYQEKLKYLINLDY